MRKAIAVLWLGSVPLFASAVQAQTPLPAPWRSTDIGAVGTPGTAYQGLGGGFYVVGAGSDIWGTADSFLFVHQPIRDGSISAKIGSQTNTNAYAKAGVMIRQSLDPGSPEVVLDIKPDGGLEFMTRSSQGGETTYIGGSWVQAAANSENKVAVDVTLELFRTGAVVSALYCTPFGDGGRQCSTVGSTSFPLGPAFIGVAVTSHDPSVRNEVHFPTGPVVRSVPNPWVTYDVGSVGTSGYATYDTASDTFFVSGAGSDIWGVADSFHAVSQGFNSDSGSLSARVVSQQNTHPFAKAGVMMGASSPPGSARVVLDARPDGSIEFMARRTDGASMSFISSARASFPVWLQLTRTGNEVEGSMSPDGQTWTPVGRVNVTLPAGITGGLAVTSHDSSALNTARFDHVSISSGPAPTQNLLVNGGFEESAVPATGPGWVADGIRQSPARSEMVAPNSGLQNGACRTTSALDCGIYQDLTIPANGNYMFSVYASADRAGGLVGLNLNGESRAMQVAQGGYQAYVFGFFARAGEAVRVWMYSPATPGFVGIDDVSLVVYLGPR
jgi:hypothetical protein